MAARSKRLPSRKWETGIVDSSKRELQDNEPLPSNAATAHPLALTLPATPLTAAGCDDMPHAWPLVSMHSAAVLERVAMMFVYPVVRPCLLTSHSRFLNLVLHEPCQSPFGNRYLPSRARGTTVEEPQLADSSTMHSTQNRNNPRSRIDAALRHRSVTCCARRKSRSVIRCGHRSSTNCTSENDEASAIQPCDSRSHCAAPFPSPGSGFAMTEGRTHRP